LASHLAEIVRTRFADKKLVVVGDLVADQFINGTISRVSREAPVFILSHDATQTVPGSAGNAAVNAASLGANAVLVGLRGLDANGALLSKALEQRNVTTSHIVAIDGLQTTTKVRVIAGHPHGTRQQVIRIDYEDQQSDLHTDVRVELRRQFAAAAETADGIIISDYGYGVVFRELFEDALHISRRRGIPLTVDSRHRLSEFSGATSATPNRDEVGEILGGTIADEDCSALCKRLDLHALLVTHGNRGLQLFERGKRPLVFPAVGSDQPVDVTGAGDTVIAAYTLALSIGLSFVDAAVIANHAGGIVVMKRGTASVTAEELAHSLVQA
jgi:D-glycero-beta-D-manno-heptose-7-phosphate kinase